MKYVRKPAFLLSIGLAATLVLGGCSKERRSGYAERETPAEPGKTGTASRVENANVSAADREFMMRAAQGGMAEVEMGRMTKDKASSQTVKDFGDRLITDHTKANDELKEIANKNGVDLPAEVDAKHRPELERLANLTGNKFDEQFMKTALRDHEKDTVEFQKEIDNGQNPDVKSFASKTLPIIQEHLRMARDWKKKQ